LSHRFRAADGTRLRQRLFFFESGGSVFTLTLTALDDEDTDARWSSALSSLRVTG
jgi:hypothetical protein